MIFGKAPEAHRVMRTAESMTRPPADATASNRRCEVVTYSLPGAATLRMCCEWQLRDHLGPDLRRIAHHEAGHVILLEWLGLDRGITATAAATHGLTTWSPKAATANLEPTTDPTGKLAASAAALHHAGVMAELIFTGVGWRGPIWYARELDYRMADDMLSPIFGRHASGAHAFAQKVALTVLNDRWERVQEVAQHLIDCGSWQSQPLAQPTHHEIQHGAKNGRRTKND